MIEFRCLLPDELDDWIDHCTGVFFNGSLDPNHRRYFEHAWNYDPQHDLSTILVAVEGNRILSAVQIRKTKMYLGGKEVAMGGVANVATLPEARRQGLSTRLLQESIRLMEDTQMPVSLLQTGIPQHYNRLGWECISLYQKTLQVERRKPANFKAQPLDFGTPCGEPNITEDIVTASQLQASFASRFNGPLVRCQDEWRKFWPNASFHWWAAKAGGRILAYICLKTREEGVVVKEFGAMPGDEGLFDPLLYQVLEKMSLPINTVTCPGVIPSRLEVMNWEEQTHWMARLNQPFSLDGLTVETTADLNDLMRGPGNKPAGSQFTFFENDGF